MNIAFFNYLMLEKGGGTARFFKDAAFGLKIRYPELKISIITFNKSLTSKVNSLYSFYFQRDVSQELSTTRQNLSNDLAKKGISYTQVESLAELRNKLERFDIVYSKNDIVETFILKFLVGQKHLKKIIFGFHTPIYYEHTPSWQAKLHNLIYGSFFYKFLLNGADRFHILNRFDEKLLKKYFKDKIIIKIYNPFDFKSYEKQASSKSFWQASKTSASRISKQLIDSGQTRVTRILWVGRLTKEKGVDDLLYLIAGLNSSPSYKKIYWQIAGVGEYEKEVRAISRRFINITYLGYLDNKRLSNIYNQSDVLLSTSKWETFPYTFLEAQSFGLPIISYNIHGCSEIVKDGVNGYLVDSLDEFKNKIVFLSNQKRSTMKRNAIRKYITKLIDNEEIYTELYKLFINNI